MRCLFVAFALTFGAISASTAQFYVNDVPMPWPNQAAHLAALQSSLSILPRTSAQHLSEDTWDIAVCEGAFIALSKNAAYIKATKKNEIPEYATWKQFLNFERQKSNPYIQSIIRYPERYSIYFSFHKEISVANYRGLNCDIATTERIRITEKQGVDKNTFALRQRQLKFLSNIAYPKDGLQEGIAFESYEEYLDETHRLYTATDQRMWVREEAFRTISKINSQIQSKSPVYLPESYQIMDTWKTKLNRFLK